MLLRKAYYSVKPFIPWRWRAAMRRALIRFSEHRYVCRWPIDPVSWRKPDQWPGWPSGKKFAFVITHDVESAKGVANVRKLMEVEKKLGFRSSFNFVPEGYDTPLELRNQLKAEGFEVGIHDLKHDGKLYQSREHFIASAKKINQYAKDWGVVGFRSAFMLHNLEWLKDLEMEYDLSTFDTDPFEPQPDGMRTVFPFWVERADGSGYMEMPYTLPQDSTLFVYGCHETAELWKQKADWVIEQGGLVLVNVHPDYIAFEGQEPKEDEFPVSLYEDLLRHIRDKYEGQYHHALAKDLSRYCAQFKPKKVEPSGKRICMVSYSFYESDNRVHRYGDALTERGDEVHVLSLGREGAPKHEVVQGVHVWRIQRRKVNERGKLDYAWRLLRFLFVGSGIMARNHLQYRYHCSHIHSVPDFLVFTAWLPKLMGSKVILDIHDILPEFYASKFKVGVDSPIVDALKKVEWISARFADHVIIANDLWFDLVTGRSVPKDRCTPYINYIDLISFAPRPRQRPHDKVVVIFPGGMQWHQGLDIAIRAFSLFEKQVPGAEFHIYGEGNTREELEQLVVDLGLSGKVIIGPFRPITEVPQLMADADIGVVPKRADSFGNEAYSTKIMEFMSQRIPVVVSRTKIDSFYFNDNVVNFFESGNVEDMANKMLEIVRDQKRRDSLVHNAWDYIQTYSWGHRKLEYRRLVDSLIEGENQQACIEVKATTTHAVPGDLPRGMAPRKNGA